MMIHTAPSFSDDEYSTEWGSTMGGQDVTTSQKDECLLVARNCSDGVDTIQQRIDKLRIEINKGTEVYTPEELKKLNNKLDDENRLFNDMTIGG